jgi:hypothetical protein
LNNAHDSVGAGAHVVGRNAANGGVETRGCRTDAQEQRNLNEEDDEAAHTVGAGRTASASSKVASKWDRGHLQSNDGEDYHKRVEREDISDAEGEAKDHAQNTDPAGTSGQLEMPMLISYSFAVVG